MSDESTKFGQVSDDSGSIEMQVTKTYTSGIFMTSINITNVIIGSGIITLPISFSNSGLGMAILILFIAALLAHYTILCLAKLAEMTGKETYQDYMQATLGMTGYVIITICLILYPLFAVLSYGIVVGGNFRNIFAYLAPNVPILSNKFLIIGVSMFGIIFPLASVRNIAFMDKMSLVSIICVVYYFLVVVAMVAFVPSKIFLFPQTYSFVRSRIPQSISVVAFALSCHQTTPVLYLSQKNRTVRRFGISSYIAIGFSTVVYALMGLLGYITFAGNVDGNLLENYCPDDKVITSARVLFSLTVILSSPMQLFTTRDAISNIAYRYFKFNWYFHIGLTFVLTAIAFVISSLVDDLGLVVGIAGALVGSPIVFILPTVALFFGLRQGWKPNTKTKAFCLIIAIIGTALIILGVVMTIVDSGSIQRIRYWCDFLVKQPTSSLIPDSTELKGIIINAWGSI